MIAYAVDLGSAKVQPTLWYWEQEKIEAESRKIRDDVRRKAEHYEPVNEHACVKVLLSVPEKFQ